MRVQVHFDRHYPIQSPMGRLISGICLAAGLLVCLFGVYSMWSYSQIEDELVPVEAVIEEIEVWERDDDREYDVYVSYTYRGKQYDRIHLDWYNSSMDEGEQITLKIHPSRPSEPVSNPAALALIVGSIFTLVGSGLSVCAWRDKLKERFPRKEEPLC